MRQLSEQLMALLEEASQRKTNRAGGGRQRTTAATGSNAAPHSHSNLQHSLMSESSHPGPGNPGIAATGDGVSNSTGIL